MKNSKIVFTDSGGIQEETSLLGIPCVTIKQLQKDKFLLKKKTNIVTGYNLNKIRKAILYFNQRKIKPSNTFGNGNVALKIFYQLKKLKKINFNILIFHLRLKKMSIRV